MTQITAFLYKAAPILVALVFLQTNGACPG
jgi:hypothetical protein